MQFWGFASPEKTNRFIDNLSVLQNHAPQILVAFLQLDRPIRISTISQLRQYNIDLAFENFEPTLARLLRHLYFREYPL